MQIALHFHFNDQDNPSAITGVIGPVTDLLTPSVRDTVWYCEHEGAIFMGRITDRLFRYEMQDGPNVDGAVTVVLSMDRLPIQ